jgi:hypothetical protein
MRQLGAFFSLLLAAAILDEASAATLNGQQFDDTVQLANQPLRLNGMGERAVLFIRGYAAGLYLQDKKSSLEEIVALRGPKRLQLRMLREAGPDDFNRALVSGIQENVSADEFTRLSERVGQLEQIITNVGISKPGDVINFDYLPGHGTIIAVNGASKGVPIVGADFYNAVLAIFIGNRPVDARLKTGLLGQL